MPSQEDPQQPIILRTPTPVSSPSQSQITPSTHSHRNRPAIHLIPPPSFTSATTGTNSFAPSSSTTASTMATPVDPTSVISIPTQPYSPPEGWEDLPPSLIDTYDLTTLRSKLQLANQLIKTLSSSLTAMRTNAAHYLLQHKILEMETTEAAARHQVESEITRREVEVLRLDQSTFSSTQQVALAEENETYKRRLRRAKRSIREYREELGDIKEENERLKKRIRDNRQHQLDASRSPDARHGAGGGRASSATAERHSAINGRANGTSAETNTNEDDGLAALRFLASQVLSQEMDEDDHDDKRRASTPKLKPRKPTITTATATPAPHITRRALMSPVAFTSSTTSRGQKRPRSRDSTISASDGEDASSDINESGKRRRIGAGANILHSVNRQRRCTHSPHPTPTAPLINEHRNNRRHHIQGANTPPLARTLPPGTPVSPPGRRGKVRDVRSDQHLGLGLGVGLGLGLDGGIRSPP